jgi:hypothetical protein
MSRIFLLSPASTSGRRAGYLLAPGARFDLAQRVRAPGGAAIGEVFAFLSGLYFRGKLTYARAFATPDRIRVITADRGLLPAEHPVTLADLRAMARVDIALAARRFRAPLARDVAALAADLGGEGKVVLLGSIATDKYAAVLLEALGGRLLFPEAFVGRGDMSRGGLLLRAARSGEELAYRPLAGAVRHGPRPAKLTPY